MGNYINGVAIDQIISVLNKTLPLINSMKETIKKDLSDHTFSDTMKTALQLHSDQIHDITMKLKSIDKNTVYPVNFIDAFAMKDALEEFGSPIESVDILPMWHDSNKTPDDSKPDYFIMVVEYSRYSMDPNGFHNGYENVTFEWKLYDKRELGLSGIPFNLSHLVCLPQCDQLEIINKNLPDEEFPTIDSHESDCEVFNRDLAFPWNPEFEPFPDDCTCECNHSWEGYTHPDDDFFYSDIDNVIHLILLNNFIPDAEFDQSTRMWSLNERNYVVGDSNDEWWLG